MVNYQAVGSPNPSRMIVIRGYKISNRSGHRIKFTVVTINGKTVRDLERDLLRQLEKMRYGPRAVSFLLSGPLALAGHVLCFNE